MRQPGTGFAAILGLLLAACGPPTGPTVTLHPSPQARPTLFWPDASADHYDQSWILAEMTTWQSFDLTVRPLAVHELPGQRYGNSLAVWLMPSEGPDDPLDQAIAFNLSWVHGSDGSWAVCPFQGGWTCRTTRLRIPLGEARSWRVIRRADQVAEFLVDGQSVLELPDPVPIRYVRFIAVGAGAEVRYDFPPRGPDLGATSRGGAGPCTACAPIP
jgi:hypothetical protein